MNAHLHPVMQQARRQPLRQIKLQPCIALDMPATVLYDITPRLGDIEVHEVWVNCWNCIEVLGHDALNAIAAEVERQLDEPMEDDEPRHMTGRQRALSAYLADAPAIFG